MAVTGGEENTAALFSLPSPVAEVKDGYIIKKNVPFKVTPFGS